MKHALAVLVVLALLSAACSQAAPSQTSVPTPMPASPTKAPEPTKAQPASTGQPATTPVAQASPAAAKKVEFPEKGKSISFVVPYAPGGAADTSARVVASLLEKELGTPIQIVNKAGAGSQLGCTDVATAKPDGYTILYTSLPSTLATYLDTERKAVYTRKSFEPIAMTTDDSLGVAVRADSPYKTLKDYVDAAKARPGEIKIGTAGIMSPNHLAGLLFQKAAGLKLSWVHFDGGAPEGVAIVGGHIDSGMMMLSTSQAQLKAGTLRILAISDTEESEFAPGAPTMVSQGYKVVMGAAHFAAAPAGTPREIVDLLSKAIKKVSDSEEFKSRLKSVGLKPSYKDPEQLSSYWAQLEADVSSIIDLAKEK